MKIETNYTNYKGKIENIEKIAFDTFKIDISSPLKNILPGQFISILCPTQTLRRPFSAAGFENGLLTILLKLKGDGTSYLANLKIHDEIDFLAPMGNGFDLSEKTALLVGAGIGIAPMLFLKKELTKNNIKNYLITGFKNENEIIPGSEENIIGGSVLDNIYQTIEATNAQIVYSCGPLPVLKGIAEICEKTGIECQLAMEKVMACSIGVCRGCVIKLIKDNETINASVCKDGPVFKGSEIIWD